MQILAVTVAWCAVWLCGAALTAALRGPFDWRAPGEAAWTKGVGFLIGAFVLTMWMRGLSAMGVAFGRTSVLLPIVALAVAALYVAQRRGALRWPAMRTALVDAVRLRELAGWRRAAFAAIVAWLALRYVLLFVDVALQPLYPWDAWIQWATKARVWFELRRIVPFVPVDQWLAAGGAYYTDAAPGYPATVPLWQVFSALVLGRFDDALMNIPWWMLSLAFTIALYGALRRLAFEPLAALCGTLIVSTIPIVNVHVALAGYADLPMAAFFTLAALALLHALDARDRGDALVALLLGLACPTIKQPGIVWLATLAVPLAVVLLPRVGIKLVLAGFGVVLCALLVLAQTSALVMGYHLHLDFAPPWNGLFESLFMLGTWNILWYGIFAAAVIGARDCLAPRIAPLTMLVATGVLFLFFVFAFTNARAWVESQTTVNRALLHLAPLLAVWAMVVFRAWSRRFADATMATA
ncbi:MAG TPA: hypothetical protein VGR63_14230 [Casimicrobiaceae bacterium]|nr:hypothetical protein [Casimicrobiaceae bacterium]